MGKPADKEEIVPVLFKFFIDSGITINGGLTKASVYKFYKDLKLFEYAFTAVYGKVSLRGIGRFSMTGARGRGQGRKTPRLFAGKGIDQYFKDNPQDAAGFFDRTQPKIKLRERVFYILKRLRGNPVITYDNFEVPIGDFETGL